MSHKHAASQPAKKALTIGNVAQLLKSKEMISEGQYQDLLARGAAQQSRLQGPAKAGGGRRHHQEQLSPAEVISSFNLEVATTGRLLTEDAITEAIALAVGLPYVKIDPMKLDLETVTGHIPRPYALKHLIAPIALEEGGGLVVAVADPYNDEAIESLATSRKLAIRRVLSSRSDINKILREFFGFRASVLAAESQLEPGSDLGNLEQFFTMKPVGEEGSDNNIIVAVDHLLNYAFDQRASDIHIEPKREKSLVRLRVDGVLHNVHMLPKGLHAPMVSRIKLLSRMDLAEKRRPQDGRIKTTFRDKEVELRVSTIPVAFGEKVVIRIFDPEILLQDLDRIGFYPREYQLYESFIRKPNGIILVTGPTGSGKTTTLYSTLRALASPEVNIVTVEDPIEMVLEEFNQVGVQSAIGVTFSNILRTILRQDPDIIMVGEIRDQETADHAVQAAMTGHLVLSTLHTNDAPSAITRLLDLGVPSFLIGSTVVGIIAQRLVRRICPACKVSRPLSSEEIAYLRLEPREYTVYEGSGCGECRGTGYRGRTGIFEVLDMSEQVKACVTAQTDLTALTRAALNEGMVPLRQVAIQKLLEGATTYEEVIAVTG